jgi:uncharacterized protein YlbG (UPF0298 family)
MRVEEDAIVSSQQLRRVRSLSCVIQVRDSLEKFLYEEFEKKKVAQGPYLLRIAKRSA